MNVLRSGRGIEDARTRLHIIVIVLVCLATRLAAGWVVGNRFQPTTWEYETLATNMLAGQGYVIDYRDYGQSKALMSPGYPLLTYLVYRVFGVNHALMLFVQALLMTAFGMAVWALARFLFRDAATALAAGLLAVLHPGILYYSSVNLHSMMLYLPLFYGSILLFCLLHASGRWRHAVGLGLCGGLAVLTRSTVLPVLVLGVGTYVLTAQQTGLHTRVRQAFAVLALVAAVNAPWAIRNVIVLDSLVGQSTKWENFWIGNNPNASGGNLRPDGSLVLDTKPPAMQAALVAARHDELAVEAVFRGEAIDFVINEPYRFASGLLRKAAYFWWFYPQSGILYPRAYLTSYKVLYAGMVVVCLLGLALCQRHRLWRREMLYPALLVLGIWGTHTLVVTEMRHRWTVEPVMLLFMAPALTHLAALAVRGGTLKGPRRWRFVTR